VDWVEKKVPDLAWALESLPTDESRGFRQTGKVACRRLMLPALRQLPKVQAERWPIRHHVGAYGTVAPVNARELSGGFGTMSRPSYALTFLLLVFSGSLLLVGKARSEQLLNSRHGGGRPAMCPLLADELGDGGLGLHFGNGCLGAPPYEGRLAIPLRRTTMVAPPCAVSEWFGQRASCVKAQKPSLQADNVSVSHPTSLDASYFISGHDAVYDAAVYGRKAAASPHAANVSVRSSDGWDGWDWCEDACLDFPSPREKTPAFETVRKADIVVPSSGRELEAEPDSLEDYFALYGGRPQSSRPAYQGCWTEATRRTPSPAKLEAPQVNIVGSVERWWDASLAAVPIDHLWCRLESLRLTWKYRVIDGWAVARRQWVTLQQSTYKVTDRAPTAGQEPIPVRHTIRRMALLSAAGSLHHVSQVLQNASRHLTQMVENDSLEISTAPPSSSAR
jgi:hypothetical protein